MDYTKFDRWREGAYQKMHRMMDRLDLSRLEPGEVDVDGHEANESRVQLPEFLVSRNPFLDDSGADPRTGPAPGDMMR